MVPPQRDAPEHGRGWTIIGVVLLVVSAVTQIAYGAAAIGGLQVLQDNVEEIESQPQFGKLYLGLGTWGVLLVLAGLGQAVAAQALARGRRSARLGALLAVLPGMVAAVFTLALFRGAALVSLALLVSTLYVLSYRVSD